MFVHIQGKLKGSFLFKSFPNWYNYGDSTHVRLSDASRYSILIATGYESRLVFEWGRVSPRALPVASDDNKGRPGGKWNCGGECVMVRWNLKLWSTHMCTWCYKDNVRMTRCMQQTNSPFGSCLSCLSESLSKYSFCSLKAQIDARVTPSIYSVEQLVAAVIRRNFWWLTTLLVPRPLFIFYYFLDIFAGQAGDRHRK